MPIVSNVNAWVAHHRLLMTLFEITTYVVAWTTVIVLFFTIARETLSCQRPELPNWTELKLARIRRRRARNRARALLQRLEVARARHRHLRVYIAGWGIAIVWLLLAMFSTLLLCAVTTTYQVLRPHLLHNKIFFVFSPPVLVVFTLGCIAVTLRLFSRLVDAISFPVTADKILKQVRAILWLHLPAEDIASLIARFSEEYCEPERAAGIETEDTSMATRPQ